MNGLSKKYESNLLSVRQKNVSFIITVTNLVTIIFEQLLPLLHITHNTIRVLLDVFILISIFLLLARSSASQIPMFFATARLCVFVIVIDFDGCGKSEFFLRLP